MQTLQFVTKGKNCVKLWAEVNTLKGFRDVMQYLIDNYNTDDFYIIDKKKEKVYTFNSIAYNKYYMRKRNFYEKNTGFLTGKWNGIEL